MSGSAREDWSSLRRQWFGSVYEIADIEFQCRTWLSPPTSSPHWSYIEFCCSYPQLDQLEFALNDGFLSRIEFDLLASLGRAIEEHRSPQGNDYDHSAILEDPTWHTVVAKAERARQELLRIVSDPNERSYLIGRQPIS
jgi:hypothetical protein